MDWFDDIQIEELENFDFIEEDISELIEEQKNFNMNEYLNSNIDYWLWLLTLLTSAEILSPSLVLLVYFQRFLLLLLLSAGSSILLTMFVWHLVKWTPNSPLTPILLYPEKNDRTNP